MLLQYKILQVLLRHYKVEQDSSFTGHVHSASPLSYLTAVRGY